MVHASCVRAFGKMSLAEGAGVLLLASHGQRGLNAQELLEVDEVEASATGSDISDNARPTEYLGAGTDADVGPLVPARVKWFDKQKGFGFVNIFGRSDDVFVHMETVRRCGFQDLASGEGMAVRTFRGPRGLMVAELKLWESAVSVENQG
jgi:CspA family cold shock protein